MEILQNMKNWLVVFIVIVALTGCRKNVTLIEASRQGDLNSVRSIIATGKADLTTCSKQGWTALHEAASFGHEEVVRELLRAKIDPNARTKSGLSALDQAIASEHFGVVKALIEGGADYKSASSNGRSPEDVLRSIGRGGLLPL
jgi:ankyrin repeat protein